MTQNQLEAAIRNAKRDAAFWASPERIAKWEREMQEYEDFCKRFGRPA